MALFSCAEIDREKELYKFKAHEEKCARYINEDTRIEIRVQIGEMKMNQSVHFATDTRWHLHDLVVACIHHIGPCEMYFATFAIKEYQARLITGMKRDGLLTKITALLDYRNGTRDADAFQLLKQNADEIGFILTHAKLTVLQNEKWSVVIAGSANFTSNTSADIGVITFSKEIADYRIQWIKKNIENGNKKTK